MRKYIDMVGESIDLTESDDGPEWFRWMFGTAIFNIDQARQMIETGEVKAQKHSVPVANCYLLLGLDKEEFGSNEFTDDWDSGRGINPMSAIQKRSTMQGMPDDKLNEPALIAMIDGADIMGRVGLKLDKKGREESKPSPVLIDGNHRLGRMYLEGVETAYVYVIPHEEALKFCYDRHMQPILKDASYRR